MGILKFLGFGAKDSDLRLVVATYEGPGRLRLNANRTASKSGKRGAVAHERTVCWIEFSPEGVRLDQGTGQAAGKVGAAKVEALLRELPQNPACKAVLDELGQGRQQASRILSLEKWGHFGAGLAEAAEGDQPRDTQARPGHPPRP